MMHLRNKYVNPVVLLVLPTLLVLTAFGCRRGETNSNTQSTTNAATTNSVPVDTTPVVTVNVNVVDSSPAGRRLVAEAELLRLASAFAERYGSYSNQTDFSNLESLFVFMTPAFAKRSQEFVRAERAKHRDTSIYYGITTRAVSITTNVFDVGRSAASFAVVTLRKETIGTSGNIRSFQEKLVVDMRKTDGAWKIDAASWEGRQ
ncbi:MAG: hypothetical protein HY340_01120 [Candidatus Kerfeldbacteria bacterium]|nr:hypothetical protein [Candidatus Kerfeldbacteria bacterium]